MKRSTVPSHPPQLVFPSWAFVNKTRGDSNPQYVCYNQQYEIQIPKLWGNNVGFTESSIAFKKTDILNRLKIKMLNIIRTK
jgi:hypothetical protein